MWTGYRLVSIPYWEWDEVMRLVKEKESKRKVEPEQESTRTQEIWKSMMGALGDLQGLAKKAKQSAECTPAPKMYGEAEQYVIGKLRDADVNIDQWLE
eukprot:3822612-Rhodomonas_salina.2